MSSVLTCLTCQVKFHDTELHRDHFKGDWHRYNLKRKVSSLPIVSSGAFDERRAAHEKQVKVEEGRNKSGDYCVACGKCFKNNKAYENHIQSKKHQEMILKFERPPAIIKPEIEELEEEDEDDMEIEEVDSDEWEDDPIEITDCLFDSHHSSSLEKNLSYMMTNYSFFLPDPEFITDLEGLMGYLGAKVGQGHMCLWCNKRFSSVRDVQRHMVDTGHCKLRFDTEAMMEYDEWYDYTASYPDQENPEGEVDLNVLDDSGFELVLPSGTKIGHRSLLRFDISVHCKFTFKHFPQILQAEPQPQQESRAGRQQILQCPLQSPLNIQVGGLDRLLRPGRRGQGEVSPIHHGL